LTVDAHDDNAAGTGWQLLAVSASVSLVMGVLVLTHPHPSIKFLGVLLGIDLLIAGVLFIIRGASSESDAEAGPYAILLGILALIAGLVVIRNPAKSLSLLVMAFAVYLIVVGAVVLGRGLAVRVNRSTRVVSGLLMVTAGTLIVAWHDPDLHTLAVLAGLTLVLQGLIGFAQAYVIRRETSHPVAAAAR
jgi:drug/metabolite transporter (DMT)-like permease